jgi:hypothetical protein
MTDEPLTSAELEKLLFQSQSADEFMQLCKIARDAKKEKTND